MKNLAILITVTAIATAIVICGIMLAKVATEVIEVSEKKREERINKITSSHDSKASGLHDTGFSLTLKFKL